MRRVAIAVTLLASACDTKGSVTADGAMPDAGVVVAPPSPPTLTPCPDGWRAITDARGVVTCDPWPTTGWSAACVPGEAHFPGTPGCAPIGTDCAADGWPSDLPTDRPVVWVDDDAAPGGDGAARDSAFVHVADAILFAPSGAVIAIATGTYDEPLVVLPDLALWGACVSGTHLGASVPSDRDPVVRAHGGASLHNLSIDTSPRVGVDVHDETAPVTLDRVEIRRNAIFGLFVLRASVVADRVLVAYTRPDATGMRGLDVDVEPGSSLTLAHAVIAGGNGAGLSVVGAGTTLDASDLAIESVEAISASGLAGHGLDLGNGAHGTLSRFVIEDAHEIGAWIVGGTLDASDGVVRRTVPLGIDPPLPDPPTAGRGVDVESGGSAVLTRVLVEDVHDVGAYAGEGCALTLHDSVVRRTTPAATLGDSGRGIDVELGGSIALDRCLVEESTDIGVYVSGAGASAQLGDLAVRATAPRASDGTSGRGITLQLGAQASLSRIALSGNATAAMTIAGDGTMVSVEDLDVTDTRGDEAGGAFGRGVDVTLGAHATLTRVHVAASHNAGLFANGAGSRLEASDVIVEGTMPDASTGGEGAAVWAQLSATLVLRRVSILGSALAGVVAVGGADVTLEDLTVSRVVSSGCEPVPCTGTFGGFGLVAHLGGTLRAARFALDGASLCGVMVGTDDGAGHSAAIDLTTGSITSSPIGACVQDPSFDAERLHTGVEFRDVDVPLQATSYPLPSAQAP